MTRAVDPLLVEPLALERNLALMAGAGAGKTYSLVTICLHLLGGARRDGVALKPAELFLLTFTDKAAGEMRTRLRDRVDRLARGRPGPTEELELQASFARHGRPFPPPDFWRRVRDDLGAATIGTFHSLCVQLLRRAPAGFGVDPAFDLLDESDAPSLLADCAERVVLEALDRGDPGVAELCRDLNLTTQGRTAGLVEQLARVLTRVREEGQSPSKIRLGCEAVSRADFDAAVREVRLEVEKALAADQVKGKKFTPMLRTIARALEGLAVENFLHPERWPAIEDALLGEERVASSPHMRPVKYRLEGKREQNYVGLVEHFAGVFAARQEEAFRGQLVSLARRYREELDKRAVLDFTELLIRTRDLLREEPSVRQEVQARVKALLVDEFQDTNRLQLELVTLLAEERSGAARLVRDGDESEDAPARGQLDLTLDSRKGGAIAVEDVPLEPALLAVVGDRKQSIYEFRGADVSVFERIARQIERFGGTRHFLQTNRRSSPALLGFFNDVFAQVMARPPDARDFEVGYVAEEDDLRPHRAQQIEPPAVERLAYEPAETAMESRHLDAENVARRLASYLAPDSPHRIVDPRDGALRRPRGGDVAILFRAFTNLETYRQALVRHGVPHRVVRGRGFYGAQEVLDLASLLALLADPHDRIAFAAVLRSPLVALSDASLFKLAWADGRKLDLARVLADPARASLVPADERPRFERFLALYGRLRRERDRLGVRVLLQVALEETGFRVAIAGTAFAEQALANVDKLLDLAGRQDARGLGDCATFARELVRLAEEEPREAQADVLDASDPRAVQLLTVHRAKGLEWPVVVVPDLATSRPFSGERVVFDRRLGLAVKPSLGDENAGTSTPRHIEVAAELRRREKAESLRTLYVALTRARDLLILSGESPRANGDSWRRALGRAMEASESVREAIREVDVAALRPPPPPRPPPGGDGREERARVERAMARARGPRGAVGRELVLPVTQLQDFFLCPRRYLYAHEVGLSEFPIVIELPDVGEGSGDGAAKGKGDPRARGTLAHALLERVDLGVVRDGGRPLKAHLEKLLWAEGERPEDAANQEVVASVEAFLRTSFARRMAAAGEARVHRELPFLLRVGEGGEPALFLKGKIDLLFEDDDGSALVLDYKFSRPHPAGLDPYAFQLDCYALAARQLVREGVRVRTGIAFLRDGAREPDVRHSAPESDGGPGALATRLLAGAQSLLDCSRSREWPGRAPEECERIRCGYQWRCHPDRAR